MRRRRKNPLALVLVSFKKHLTVVIILLLIGYFPVNSYLLYLRNSVLLILTSYFTPCDECPNKNAYRGQTTIKLCIYIQLLLSMLSEKKHLFHLQFNQPFNHKYFHNTG